jgi:CDGSH-type Zn-finger protein
MARIVRHDAKAPAIVKVGDKVIAVCQCGLSKNKPFCDGTHHGTEDEKDGVLYVYDVDGKRVMVNDMHPHPKKTFVQ